MICISICPHEGNGDGDDDGGDDGGDDGVLGPGSGTGDSGRDASSGASGGGGDYDGDDSGIKDYGNVLMSIIIIQKRLEICTTKTFITLYIFIPLKFTNLKTLMILSRCLNFNTVSY